MSRNITKIALGSGLIIFSIISNTAFAQPFTKKGEIIQATNGRWGAMSVAVNGKIYAGGGYVGTSNMIDWQEYNPATGTWTPKTNYMPGQVANRSAGITFVINGKAYLGLGAEHFLSFNPSLPTKELSDLWSYDPATDKWVQHASLPDSGRNSSAVFVINNKAYVVGGQTNSMGNLTNDVWEYDPATDKWTLKGSFPGGAVRSSVGFSINNKGYITGGVVDGQPTPLKKLYEFNGSSWAAKADFPADTARQGAVSFVVNNKAYVGLGGTYAGYPATFFTYDPASDKWSFLTDKWSAPGRLFGRAEVIGNKAYIGMGWRLDGGSTQTFFKDWYETDAVGLLDVNDVTPQRTSAQVYPNPTSGMLQVKGEFSREAICKIYTIDGKMAGSIKMSSDNTINLTAYPAGQYILKIADHTQEAVTTIEITK